MHTAAQTPTAYSCSGKVTVTGTPDRGQPDGYTPPLPRPSTSSWPVTANFYDYDTGVGDERLRITFADGASVTLRVVLAANGDDGDWGRRRSRSRLGDRAEAATCLMQWTARRPRNLREAVLSGCWTPGSALAPQRGTRRPSRSPRGGRPRRPGSGRALVNALPKRGGQARRLSARGDNSSIATARCHAESVRGRTC